MKGILLSAAALAIAGAGLSRLAAFADTNTARPDTLPQGDDVAAPPTPVKSRQVLRAEARRAAKIYPAPITYRGRK